jgi:hypothetical protein
MASLEWVRSWWRGETVQPLRPLLEWLGRSPVLPVLQALPVCIVWGAFSELGLPSLFLNDVPRVTFIAAFMAAMLLGQLCFIGYLLDADEPWALAPRRGKPGGVPPTIRWYLFRTGVYPAWLVALSVPCFIDRHFAFLFGVLAALGAMLLLTRGAERLQHWYESDRQRHPWLRRIEVTLFRRHSTNVVVLHVLQAGLLVFFLVGYLLVAAHVALTGYRGWVSPAVVICVAIGLCGALYGAVHFFFPVRHSGALILAGVLGVFAGRGCSDLSFYDELSQPTPPAYAGTSLASPRDAGLLGDDEVLNAWLARMRAEPPAGVAWPTQGETQPASAQAVPRCEPGPKPRLALVATSGGGIRAAVWTAHVLSALGGEGGVPGFHRYVRLVTGASGGMVGAGTWVAGLERGGLPGRVSLVTMMERDSLSAAAVALMLPFGANRGRAVEQAWVRHTDGLMDRSFASLRGGESEGWLPSLVYSPMLVEDGRRLLVSNLDLSALTSPEASTLVVERNGEEPRAGQKARLSVSGVQLFQLFPLRQPAFSVAAAARMSASFPYVSPASALPTSPPVRVVDAGYYDNYGVDLSAMWLHAHREWLRECTSGVVLIQIRDHLGNGRRTKLQAKGGGEVLGGLTAPLEAVLRARESSMSFRNDELLGLVQDELNVGEPCFFTTAIFEFSEAAPLSWAQTDHDQQRLQHAADSQAMRTRVAAVREWLTAGPESRERARTLALCPGGRELAP